MTRMAWWSRFFGGGQGSTTQPAAAPPGPAASPAVRPAPPTPTSGAAPTTHVLGVTPSGVEVRGFHAPAADLLPWWHRLRADHGSTGLWPVLLGPDLGDLAAALTPETRGDYDDAAQVRRATAMTLRELQALRVERAARFGGAEDDDQDDADDEPDVVRRHPPRFSVTEEDGLVALVPAAHGWQVPVVLGWEGGVNYDLEPVDHGVVLRDWQERFGAELVALSDGQVLEVLVHRPPTTPGEALAVAREQYDYCPDLVDQGVGDLQTLAREHAGAEAWSFWWD
ncbi:DUF4253 domain-containing protein [Cellulomonas sp. zg-ZUI222]|uniref:DUF4253 domain-containing protein n=1 Tax=Cellulomonas wangleii TaxID=2816956 RepID=A0ABX8D5F4_9CELL|nr:DUF4253 domain-containing protein [Cellulomonas wangleii]MBO0922126.1 DUF4253 domain-containing protein [Cellulomonas wangleii]MBO0926155.1 DUF4253 domain-containing protein [Cellulomonas wangleii]QVI62669.1 DUF4253 domain-containing protein [Cellulomonas wangleii]